MALKQLSVFVENKPGSLLAVTETLHRSGIDMRAMCVADTQDFGLVRFIASDTDKAFAALTAANLLVTRNDVVCVMIPDRPGGLTEIIRVLAETRVNIEYLYAFVSSTVGSACVILRVDDAPRADAILRERGYVCLDDAEKI